MEVRGKVYFYVTTVVVWYLCYLHKLALSVTNQAVCVWLRNWRGSNHKVVTAKVPTDTNSLCPRIGPSRSSTTGTIVVTRQTEKIFHTREAEIPFEYISANRRKYFGYVNHLWPGVPWSVGGPETKVARLATRWWLCTCFRSTDRIAPCQIKFIIRIPLNDSKN